MDTYLLALGWWNFGGSLLMLGLFNESFGRKLFNEWTQIFKTEYFLSYWQKFWMGWAIGLNIYFGLMNIFAVKWGYPEIKIFTAWFDIVAYSIFFLLAIWGLKAGRLGSGAYSVFVIFAVWLSWGLYVLLSC
jgi:hypothetical protein